MDPWDKLLLLVCQELYQDALFSWKFDLSVLRRKSWNQIVLINTLHCDGFYLSVHSHITVYLILPCATLIIAVTKLDELEKELEKDLGCVQARIGPVRRQCMKQYGIYATWPSSARFQDIRTHLRYAFLLTTCTSRLKHI